METPKDQIVSEITQSTRSKLHLLAYAACQFKPTFKEHLDPLLDQYSKESGIKLNCYIPMGCGHYEDEYDGVWAAKSIDDFPDIVASMGFGDFFRKEFVDRFVKRRYF